MREAGFPRGLEPGGIEKTPVTLNTRNRAKRWFQGGDSWELKVGEACRGLSSLYHLSLSGGQKKVIMIISNCFEFKLLNILKCFYSV